MSKEEGLESLRVEGVKGEEEGRIEN